MIKKCKNCSQPVTKPDLRRSGFCSVWCYYKAKGTKPKGIKSYTPAKHTNVDVKRIVRPSTPMLKQPAKPPPVRDRRYMGFVRTQPCLVCGSRKNIHAHHAETRGMGVKASDYTCIPLCHLHHTGGNEAVHVLGKDRFLKKFNLDLDKTYSRLKNLYEKYCQNKKKVVQ